MKSIVKLDYMTKENILEIIVREENSSVKDIDFNKVDKQIIEGTLDNQIDRTLAVIKNNKKVMFEEIGEEFKVTLELYNNSKRVGLVVGIKKKK